jgi:hypothetical protein
LTLGVQPRFVFCFQKDSPVIALHQTTISLTRILPNKAGCILEHDVLLLRLVDKVSDSSFSIPLALNQGISIQQTLQPEAFLQLIISMHNYCRFTHLRSYNQHNILAFDKLWQYIQAIVCVSGWHVTPTAHYMFHNYLKKVLVDAEASFFVLQEGSKHAMGDTLDKHARMPRGSPLKLPYRLPHLFCRLLSKSNTTNKFGDKKNERTLHFFAWP